jgi:large subunit ribosomal protein L28
MSRTCEVCGKGPASGRMIVYRGLAKKKGGVGKKITSIKKRRFLPNLQRVKVIHNGTVSHMRVCVHCIRSGRVTKAPARPSIQQVNVERAKPAPAEAPAGPPAEP